MTTDIGSPQTAATSTRDWLGKPPRDWKGVRALQAEAAASREARESLRAWLAERLDPERDHLALGIGLFAAGEPESALPHLQAAGGDLARLLAGRAHQLAGRTAPAAEALSALGASAEVGARALLWLLELQRRSGDADGAEATVAALRARGAGPADLAFADGLLAETRGDHEGAVAAWGLALQHDPDHAEARFHLAHRLDLSGQDEDALAHFAALAPSDGAAWVGALINRGVLHEDRGEYKSAIRCYRQVVAGDPTNRRARRYLADAIASLHQYYDESRERKVDKQNAVLRIPVTDFELSVRARNCLQRMNIHTLGDLVQRTETELLAFKNFGETSLQEVKDILVMKGLRLGMLPPAAEGGPLLASAAPADAAEGDMESLRINELDLSVRSRAALTTLGIVTLGDLMATTEATLLSCKNFGQTSLDEIKVKLASLGLSLAS